MSDDDEGNAPRPGAPAHADQQGSDAVCWLERVCDACGGLEDGPPATCTRCGAPREPRAD